MERFVVQAITHKTNMALIKGTLKSGHENVLDDVRSWLWQQGESPQIQIQMANAELSQRSTTEVGTCLPKAQSTYPSQAGSLNSANQTATNRQRRNRYKYL